MDFPDQIFSTVVHVLGYLGALAWLGMALLRMPWRRLYDNAFTHVFFGASVAVLLLWGLHAGVPPTLHFHLLGVTVLTLMFGWQYAALAVTLILIGTTLNGQGSWVSFGLNLLCMGAIPVTLSWWLLRWAQRRLPHNFFIYVYINGFFAAGAAILATGAAGVGLLWLTEVHTLDWLGYHYLPFFPLMFFSEAVMNGMVMTLLVALRPDWVHSFDDNLYINGK
ncbi:MAG TPA: energy-coupling factor ABC transporter permease [Gammaproteobacteria bacterium]